MAHLMNTKSRICNSEVTIQWRDDALQKLEDLRDACVEMLERCIAWAAAKSHRPERYISVDSLEILDAYSKNARYVKVSLTSECSSCSHVLSAVYTGQRYAKWMFNSKDVNTLSEDILKMFPSVPEVEGNEVHESILDGEAMLHVYFDCKEAQDEIPHSGELVECIRRIVEDVCESVGRRIGAPPEWCAPTKVKVVRHPVLQGGRLIHLYTLNDDEPCTSIACSRIQGESHWYCVEDLNVVKDDMLVSIVESGQCGKLWEV